jgi:uncharacterized membrane protein
MLRAAADVSRVTDVHAADHRENLGQLERLVSIVTGGALAVYGLKRRGASGIGIALLGAELVRRGASGHCLMYEALGLNTTEVARILPRGDVVVSRAATVNARRAIKIERFVTVQVPPEELYAFWRNFENLPRFMQHLDSVSVIDDRHSRWVAKLPGGRTVTWTAEIVNDIPNVLIAWKTVGSPDVAHAGSVHFRKAPYDRGTELQVVFDYEPPGALLISQVARLFGHAPDALVRDDLRRFKELMESSSRGQSR